MYGAMVRHSLPLPDSIAKHAALASASLSTATTPAASAAADSVSVTGRHDDAPYTPWLLSK